MEYALCVYGVCIWLARAVSSSLKWCSDDDGWALGLGSHVTTNHLVCWSQCGKVEKGVNGWFELMTHDSLITVTNFFSHRQGFWMRSLCEGFLSCLCTLELSHEDHILFSLEMFPINGGGKIKGPNCDCDSDSIGPRASRVFFNPKLYIRKPNLMKIYIYTYLFQ